MDSQADLPDCCSMGLSCSACRFKSENRAFFRREKTAPFGIARWFCLGCKPLPPARVGWVRLLAFAGVMVLGVQLILTSPAENNIFGYWIVVLGGLVALSPITILIHEAGHAAAAIGVGRCVYRINIGIGAPFRTIRLGQTEIVFGRDQRGGYVLALPKATDSRWREACMVAAGPAANFAAMLALAPLSGALYGTGQSPWGTVGSVVVASSTVSNALAGIGALIPMYVRVEGARWVSDGRRLLQLLRPRRVAPDWQVHHDAFKGGELLQAKRWAEAEAHYRAIVAAHPEQPGFLAVLLHVLALTKGPEAAMACAIDHQEFLRQEGEIAEPMAPLWSYAWAIAAWVILRSPKGDQTVSKGFSQRAVTADPASPYAHAVQGAVLVQLGQKDEGLGMILGNLKDMNSASDKLEFCDFVVARDLENADFSRSDFQSLTDHVRTLA